MKRCRTCGAPLVVTGVGQNVPTARCGYCDRCAPWRWSPANGLRYQSRRKNSVHRLHDGSRESGAPHSWEERIRQITARALERGVRFDDDLFLDC